MAGKTGDALGVDLARLWYAGSHDIPLVEDDYLKAWAKTPASVADLCRRGNGIGTDPGQNIDSMLLRVNKFLTDTRGALDEIGDALVWVANAYAETDATSQGAFEAEKKKLEDG